MLKFEALNRTFGQKTYKLARIPDGSLASYGRIMAAPVASPTGCRECERLLGELQAAHEMLAEIHREEANAAIKDDLEAFQMLQPHLKRVRKRRDEAAQAVKRHMQKHAR